MPSPSPSPRHSLDRSLSTSEPQVSPNIDDVLNRMRERLADTNINSVTLLATDYLNHFNEFVMLLDLVADSPDLQDMLSDWEPKSYITHFIDSGFSDKELAIEAYALAPPLYRDPFDATIQQLNLLISAIQGELKDLVGDSNPDRISTAVTTASQEIRRLVDIASAVTNGVATTSRQDEIDQMFNS
ncbi:MAG: hypothetical protein V3R85_05020 [Alphaproteobacteria bacterium]